MLTLQAMHQFALHKIEIETQYSRLDTNSTVFDLSLHEANSLTACPFQPAKQGVYENKVFSIKFQCIKIRQDLNYFSIQARVSGQQPAYLRIPADHVALAFVRTGWIKTKLCDRQIEKLEPGQWFAFACEQFCFDRSSDEPSQVELFLCSNALVQALLQLEGARDHSLLRNFIQGNSNSLFESGQMNASACELTHKLELDPRNQLRNRLRLEGNVWAWIAEILGDSIQQQPSNYRSISANDRDAILRVAQQIEQDPGKEYSLKDFCEMAHINENKLKLLFKQVHGKTAFTYLRETRMELAAKLLKKDRMSVIEIANEVGYSNASHFARAFKEQHQLLPKAYQCLHRAHQ